MSLRWALLPQSVSTTQSGTIICWLNDSAFANTYEVFLLSQLFLWCSHNSTSLTYQTRTNEVKAFKRACLTEKKGLLTFSAPAFYLYAAGFLNRNHSEAEWALTTCFCAIYTFASSSLFVTIVNLALASFRRFCFPHLHPFLHPLLIYLSLQRQKLCFEKYQNRLCILTFLNWRAYERVMSE